MVKVTSLIIVAKSAVGFSLGVRTETEMKIWCIQDMYMWQSHVEIEGYSVAYFERIAVLGAPYR